MKLKLELLIVASLFAYASATTWKCTDADWLKFKEEFNKSYESSEVDLSHYNTFCDNLILIDEHNNSKEKSYKLGVTALADLTPQQVSQNRQRAHRNRPIVRKSKVEVEDEYEQN